LVHLICLRCNRANAADSKFCSECGAGLLRKFCNDCHAVNDAESQFCQSCGAALPLQPFAPPAASAPPSGKVPDLTDVAFPEPDEPGHLVSAPLHVDTAAIVAAPPQLPALPTEMAPGVDKAPIAHRSCWVSGARRCCCLQPCCGNAANPRVHCLTRASCEGRRRFQRARARRV
jgi:hypothetical protein